MFFYRIWCFSAIRKDNLQRSMGTWIPLKIMLLRDIKQMHRCKHHSISLVEKQILYFFSIQIFLTYQTLTHIQGFQDQAISLCVNIPTSNDTTHGDHLNPLTALLRRYQWVPDTETSPPENRLTRRHSVSLTNLKCFCSLLYQEHLYDKEL